MKILVIDDTAEYLAQAKEQLSGHELTLLTSDHEAEKLLGVEDGGERPHFDAVLTDLMFSPEKRDASGAGAGQPTPMGSILALLALKAGVKRVAVVTTSHHDHVATAAFDAFGYNPKAFRIGDAVMLCTNRHYGYPGGKGPKTKFWGEVLEMLLAEVPEG